MMKQGYIENIVEQFFENENYHIESGSSGMNNTTKFIRVNDDRYVIRIYQSHKDISKVRYEHLVLGGLGKQNITFKIPQPIKSLCGDTVVKAEDGKLAVMFKYISGSNPKLDSIGQIYSFGKVVGEITNKLTNLKLEEQPVYSECYDLEKSYPKCPLKDVIEFCNNPSDDFEEAREELREMAQYYMEFREITSILRELPHQLIHGDINESNVLADEAGNISAVLDFEFVARDLRAMDLGICLSGIVCYLIDHCDDEEYSWDAIGNFIKGYSEEMKLTNKEIEIVPWLMMLRKLDVIVHFLVRYNEGINNSFKSADEILIEQVIEGQKLGQWMKGNKDRLIEVFNTFI